MASARVLRRHKALLVFPLMSGACMLLLQVSFLIPIMQHVQFHSQAAVTQTYQNGIVQMNGNIAQQDAGLHYLYLFLFYYCSYFIMTFFNTALISCALHYLRGEDATFKDGLHQAMQRIHHIAGWALLASTVGVVLRFIGEQSKIVGSIIAAIVGIAFSLASYFIVPVMVMEDKGPIDALKASAALFKKTWSERVVNSLSFFLIIFLFWLGGTIIAAIGITMAMAAGMTALMFLIVALGAIYCLMLILIQSALQSVFEAALYLYSKTGSPPAGFESATLQLAFKPR